MYSSSVESSFVAAHFASNFLSPSGLLVLPGAAGVVSGTPWAISYGAMKAGVHHLVKSLGDPSSGLPENTTVVGIAPVMLDTPMNRSSMPDADFSTWTSTEIVADKLYEWATGTRPKNGAVYKISTTNSNTEFTEI